MDGPVAPGGSPRGLALDVPRVRRRMGSSKRDRSWRPAPTATLEHPLVVISGFPIRADPADTYPSGLPRFTGSPRSSDPSTYTCTDAAVMHEFAGATGLREPAAPPASHREDRHVRKQRSGAEAKRVSEARMRGSQAPPERWGGGWPGLSPRSLPIRPASAAVELCRCAAQPRSLCLQQGRGPSPPRLRMRRKMWHGLAARRLFARMARARARASRAATFYRQSALSVAGRYYASSRWSATFVSSLRHFPS